MLQDRLTRRRFVQAVCAAPLAACASIDASNARQHGLATDYEVGAVYELLNDRLVERVGTLSGTVRLRRPGDGFYPLSAWSGSLTPGPTSIEDYQNHRSQWPTIIGVARSGARLRVSQIEYQAAFLTLDAWLDIIAECRDAPLRGQRVSLVSISRNSREGDPPLARVSDVDPNELRRIRD